MRITDNIPLTSGTSASSAASPRSAARGKPDGHAPGPFWRYLPLAASVALLLAALLATDTSVNNIARYAGYVLWGVLLPGTLVFRSLRRTPNTLVEDLALGAVTGLALELAAWAVFMALGIQSAITLWPLAVVIPFAAVPRLRRHWRPRGYTRVPLGWSWSVSGTVAIATAYLYRVYLERTPILPTGDQRIFVDLPYQLSLAGNAKHDFPVTLPQVAGEPLHYHWFAFVHEAMTSMVGHIDLPVVQMRLMIPALCALTMVVIAVVAWRLTGRPWAGPVAGLLVFAIGEFNAWPTSALAFGSPETSLMVWASVSMTYSQPLLFALIGAVGEGLRTAGSRTDAEAKSGDAKHSVPALGRGLYVLAGLFAFASSAAKATSLPVTLAGLALAGLVALLSTRRIPWTIVALGTVVGAGQLFSTALIFHFQSYGLKPEPLINLRGYWTDPQHVRSAASQAFVIAAVWAAFLLNTQLRVVGMVPLLWRRRLRLEPVQWFLLGGAIGGPAIFLMLNGWNASYFTHAGLAFGALLSAWGYCEVFERAALPAGAKTSLAIGSLAFVGLFAWAVYHQAPDWLDSTQRTLGITLASKPGYFSLLPILTAGVTLAVATTVLGLLWWAASRALPALRRRGGVVLLTGALVAGAPTLLMDLPTPTEGVAVWGSLPLPGKVDAARWIRDHSKPTDVLATNEHCWSPDDYANPQEVSAPADHCNNQAFTLSGYSERSVLIEGWAFAPRNMATQSTAFWDPALLDMNDAAVYHPTATVLDDLHNEHNVRYLVVNRRAGTESPLLKTFATNVYDNGNYGVYELH